jgi:hypothetical protein
MTKGACLLRGPKLELVKPTETQKCTRLTLISQQPPTLYIIIPQRLIAAADCVRAVKDLSSEEKEGRKINTCHAITKVLGRILIALCVYVYSKGAVNLSNCFNTQ